MVSCIKYALIFCFLLFIFHPLIALEETNDSENKDPARKVCVFDIAQIPKNKTNSDGELFSEVIKNTLIFELKLAGFEIIDDSIWKKTKTNGKYTDDDLLDGAKAITLARKIEADVVINGFLTLEKERLLFGLKCYDVKSRRLAVSILKSGRAGLSATSLINKGIEEIIPKISKELSTYSATGDSIEQEIVVYEDITFKEMIELGTTIKVTVKSVDEGANIFLANTPIGSIVNGELSFESKAASIVHLTVEKKKYHTESFQIEIGDADEVITLPGLSKVTHWAIDTHYTIFQTLGLGVGVRYYINPDWFFVSADCYPYLQSSNLPGTNSVLHIDTNISVGHYLFFSPSSFFRAGVFLGVGMINSAILTSDGLFVTDFYWDIIGGWIELNFKNFIIYYKQCGRYNHNILGDGFLDTGWAQPIPVVFSIGAIWKW